MESIRRAWLRLLAVFRSGRAEADLSREISAHLQLLEDDFVARGMSRRDARRAARRAFGGVEQTKERQRDARSFRWLDSLWLDMKLGVRLLVKYPGLTVVAGLAMAFAIAVGAAAFEFLHQVVSPTIPLHDGHRVVGIRLWHTESNGVEEQALHDFVSWRGRLHTIENLGAYRTVERNLIAGGTPGPALMTAEISATAFQVARTPALLGRTLVEADEAPGAPAVAVIGHDVWQARFGGDPSVVGRVVQLGKAPHTIVGVMPQGFRFPVYHSLWVPLRVTDLAYAPRRGPGITVFGRLAPGVSLNEAQAELTTLGLRAAAEYPDTHEHIQPQVLPYGEVASPLQVELGPLALLSINVFFVSLVVLVCANVALLLFARAAAREAELAVRVALGAGRARIVGQLFAEAMALGSIAAVAGLAAARIILHWWLEVSRVESSGRLPFWFDEALSPATFLYATGLTALGAGVAGVIPALKVTGRRVALRLRQATAGGGGLRFGGIWTAVIVIQVAATVAFPATAWFVRRSVVAARSLDPGFPAGQYLSAELEMDPEFPAVSSPADIRAVFPAERFVATSRELMRLLHADPEVLGVAFADRLPLTHHPPQPIEIEGLASETTVTERGVASASVDPDFFDVLGAPILAGRGFRFADIASAAPVAIVNQSFVQRVLGGQYPIGRRMRELPRDRAGGPAGPWLEIIGVVADLGLAVRDPFEPAGFYRPAAPGGVRPAHILVHVKNGPEAFAPRLHAIAAAADPTLRLQQVLPLDEVHRTLWLEFNFLFKLLLVVSAVALLLSLSGIYSVLSFTVSQRTREIGIRTALGADRSRIVAAICSRPLQHVGLGVLVGCALTAALALAVDGRLSPHGAVAILGYGVLMLSVCVLGCAAPMRRALRVEPTEALRVDA